MIKTRELALTCAGLLIAQWPYLLAQQPQIASGESFNPKIYTPDQLDSLVAPVALYPDPVLSQVLVASTYPVELMEAQRWLDENPGLQSTDAVEAAAKQP